MSTCCSENVKLGFRDFKLKLGILNLVARRSERRSPTSLLENTKRIQTIVDANRGKCWVSGVVTLFPVPLFVSVLRKKVFDMDEERIKIVVHHSGHFMNDDNDDLKFDGEIAEWCSDADLLSYFGKLASSAHPDKLELLTDDKGVMHMLNIARLNDEVHLYVVHNMVEPQIIEMIDWVGGQADDEGVEDAKVHTEGDAQEGHGVDAEVHTEGHAQEGGEVNVEDGEVQVEDADVQVEDADVRVEDADVHEVEDGEVEDGDDQVKDGEVQVEDVEVHHVEEPEVHEVDDFKVEDLGEDDDLHEDSEGKVEDSEGEEVHEAESEEEDLHDVTVQCDIGTSKGNVREEHCSPVLESSQSTNNEKNMHDVRGLSDNEWLSEELISGGESEDDDGSSKTLMTYYWVGWMFFEKQVWRGVTNNNGKRWKRVNVENKETWTWFLELLIEDLGGKYVCVAITFISDQQKGLLATFKDLLPGVEQRFCAFNSVLVNSRSKPIISMLEDIRVYIMNRWVANRTKMTQYQASMWPKKMGNYWRSLSHAITAMKFLNINAEDYIGH
ncbi:hypothetical protein V8G54_007428 [Vigna mungo]|uniref:MULE transposase domain-containing protein n=1 Tax=Vigna mungo TaxID=3915 RepID=A0AAQ3P3D0_VIGMU